ncbi:hypothetical protein GF339_19335 [candidate division KSB3 bacterium]|uniref:Uncharacterized protein n=1 Tax=candidate division KSB3 bacterium TaxID=2044937 RepID=A0A9D5Q8C2_9BACT|nr:hypothetical protein [candidate division KSB3 bacterium]MBD3326746.1 hypothetical protein [candidate division KSB3 bacterium]
MNKSLRSVLELTRDALPASLIDEEGYARLARIAEHIPFELSTFWGFECRLGDADAKVDILFEIRKQSRGRSLLAGQVASGLDALCTQWPAWKRLRTFAACWADPEHEFSRTIRNIWLEFDAASVGNHAQLSDVLRQPCIFFGPDARTLEKPQASRLINEALAALDMPDAGGCDLDTFSAKLPQEARIFQVGLMLGRPNPGLRICVYRLTLEDVPGWLTDLNWPGDTAMLAQFLQKLPPDLDTFAVDLNLMKDGPAQKIGLECYMDWLENDPKQWEPLLRLLDERDLCLPAKREGLLEFQGAMRPPDDWQRASEGILYVGLYRKIHHIKLTVAADRVTEAKAYVAFNHPGVDVGAIQANHAGGAWLVE